MISEQQTPVDSGFGAKSEPSEVMEGIDLSGKTAVVTGVTQVLARKPLEPW